MRFFYLGFIALFALFSTSCGTSASAAAAASSNKTWTLCLTALDISTLPPARQAMGSIVMQSLAASLNTVDIRVRFPEESAWYRDTMWGKNRQAAASAIIAKQQERDKLIFQGYTPLRLASERKKIDKEIAALHEKYSAAYSEPPEIEKLPAFTLTDVNKSGIYPPPPDTGGEYFFCASTARADGFLAGKIIEYHERIQLTLRLYTLYTKTFSYTDTVIFSPEDIDAAVDEITARLVDELSKRKPAAIQVATNTGEAMIVIDNKLVGRGETEVFETNPGVKSVSIFNNNYRSVTLPVELRENETANISVELKELPSVSFTVENPLNMPEGGASVYRGALYVGETPLEIKSYEDREEHITVEDKAGNFALNIFKAENGAVNTKLSPEAEEGLVEKRRKQYYASNTRFWLSLPLAVFVSGVAAGYKNDYSYASLQTEDLYNKTVVWQYASVGTIGLAVGFFAESLVRAGFYMAAASKTNNPVAPHKKPVEDENKGENAQKTEGEVKKASIFQKSTQWIKGLFTKKKTASESENAEASVPASVGETETAETEEIAETQEKKDVSAEKDAPVEGGKETEKEAE